MNHCFHCSGEKLEQIAREQKIDRRCLQRWKKDKSKLLAVATLNHGAQTRYVRRAANYAKYPELESILVDWVKNTRKRR